MNRLVKKFGWYIDADDLSDNDITKYYADFLQHLRDKGYCPVVVPSLNNHYHKYNKGEIIIYEGGATSECQMDKHMFWMRCIYVGKKNANSRDFIKVEADKLVTI